MHTWIERTHERDAVRNLERWKRMRAGGWELTVLHSRRDRCIVAFGYRLPGRRA